MTQQKGVLVSIVADLRALGYGASCIARAVNRTPERIRQILRDLKLSRPRIRKLDDVPPDIRARIEAYEHLQKQNESQAG